MRASFFSRSTAPGVTSLIPIENPLFAGVNGFRQFLRSTRWSERRTEPSSAELSHLVHRRCSLVRSVIPLNDSKDTPLVSISDRTLVHQSAHDLRVLNDEVSIVRRHIGRMRLIRIVGENDEFVESLVLAFEIDEDFRILVRSHEDVEDLLSGPESNGLDDRWMREVDLEISVVEVGADLGEFGAIVEGVSSSEEVATGDEILSRGDDRLSVSRRDEILLDVHELECFRSSFFRLRNVYTSSVSATAAHRTTMKRSVRRFISSPSKSAL